jgi:hypothetical protein
MVQVRGRPGAVEFQPLGGHIAAGELHLVNVPSEGFGDSCGTLTPSQVVNVPVGGGEGSTGTLAMSSFRCIGNRESG